MNKNHGVWLALLFIIITRPGFGVDAQEEQNSKPKATHEQDKRAKEKTKTITGASRVQSAFGLVQ